MHLVRMLLIASMWGSSFLWIKFALEGLGPMQVTTARLVLGAVFLLALCLVTRLRLPRSASTWGHLFVVGLVGNTIPFAFFSYGEVTVDSGLAGVLNATTPLFTLVFAALVGHEKRPTPSRLAGVGIGFVGTLLVLAPWEAVSGDGHNTLGGLLLCLGAAICYAVALIYSSRFVVRRGLHPIVLATSQISAAAVWGVLATPALGWEVPRLSPTVLLAAGVLGVLGTGYAFVLINRLLIDIGPTRTSTVTYLMPPIAVLLGAIVLGESIGWLAVVGMLVVLAGVLLAQRTPKAAVPAPAEPDPAAPQPSTPQPFPQPSTASDSAATDPAGPAVAATTAAGPAGSSGSDRVHR